MFIKAAKANASGTHTGSWRPSQIHVYCPHMKLGVLRSLGDVKHIVGEPISLMLRAGPKSKLQTGLHHFALALYSLASWVILMCYSYPYVYWRQYHKISCLILMGPQPPASGGTQNFGHVKRQGRVFTIASVHQGVGKPTENPHLK